MKLVYTHPNIAMVVQAQALVEQAGIDCELRNQYASGAVGELAPISAWPEVWVLNDRFTEQAETVIGAMQEAPDAPDWNCSQCENTNPATFESCWHCGAEASRI